MFAYCNNNPILFRDDFGTNLRSTFVVNCVDGPGYNVMNHRLDTGHPDEFAKETDNLISDFVGINSLEDCIAFYDSLMEYDIVRDVSAIDQIASGWDMMKEGAAVYSLPIITWVDELIGGSKMIWGLGQVIEGFVELIDGGNTQ